MKLDEPVENHEHATTSLKVLLLIFSLLVVGTLFYFVNLEQGIYQLYTEEQQGPGKGKGKPVKDKDGSSEPTEDPSEPISVSSGLWISPAEISALPTSGSAWKNLKKIADSNIGSPQISDQSSKHSVKTFAVSLVYAKTGDNAYREKARVAIISAIGTEYEPSLHGVRTLALGRNLVGYVLAADAIGLKDFSPSDDEIFRTWLTGIRTAVMPDHGRWKTLIQTHENTASNWGQFAGASRIAASLYLGDSADVAAAAAIFRAYGDRGYYPSGKAWGSYFQTTNSFDQSWACSANWTAINPASCGSKSGIIVEDASRSADPYPNIDDTGRAYALEAAQGLVVQAELLSRAGYDSWGWSDQAVKRAAFWMNEPSVGALNYHSVGYHIPWLLNKRYEASLPTKTAGFGRVMGWTDWMY
jgi:hypothetical protein